MSVREKPPAHDPDHPSRSDYSARKLVFADDKSFQNELRRRVNDYFKTTGRPMRGGWQMHLKTAIILVAFVAAYTLLVFFARNVWQAIPLALLLGLATAGIGFNIQHDGGHNAYSDRPWLNKLMATTLNLVGASSYMWRWKHTIFHHTYVNITGWDNDITLGSLGRLSPHQPHRWYHRWQHIYLWPLYGFLAMKMQLVDDAKSMIRGRIGFHAIPRPRGWDLLIAISGKLVFLALAFGIPILFHPIWVVVVFYAIVTGLLGFLLSVVFQLPHCQGKSEFPMPLPGTTNIQTPWAVHQALVTLDFARHNRILTWCFGGLNFHKEHHLFPVICHINSPAITEIVEQTCRDFGVEYKEHPTFISGIVEHYRWLRKMGRGEESL